MKEYFSHDYNAREDQKIKKLLFVHSWVGYGLYWAIIETLYNNGGYLELNYESIAFDMRTDKNLIESLINDFGLFKIKNKIFFSESVLRRLNERKVKSEKAKLSALSRWNKDSSDDANALRTESDSNAIKEKKRKEKEIINNIQQEEIINRIYSLYPSRCPIQNRSLGKSKKDKERIGKILKEKTESELETIIKKYIEDCKKSKTYFKNFSTFLNNLPDVAEVKIERTETLAI
jgi:hypothetical protein